MTLGRANTSTRKKNNLPHPFNFPVKEISWSPAGSNHWGFEENPNVKGGTYL